jgi:hypothetical protein
LINSTGSLREWEFSRDLNGFLSLFLLRKRSLFPTMYLPGKLSLSFSRIVANSLSTGLDAKGSPFGHVQRLSDAAAQARSKAAAG